MLMYRAVGSSDDQTERKGVILKDVNDIILKMI